MTVDPELVTRKLLLIARDLDELAAIRDRAGLGRPRRPTISARLPSWPRLEWSTRHSHGSWSLARAFGTGSCTSTTNSIMHGCLRRSVERSPTSPPTLARCNATCSARSHCSGLGPRCRFGRCLPVQRDAQGRRFHGATTTNDDEALPVWSDIIRPGLRVAERRKFEQSNRLTNQQLVGCRHRDGIQPALLVNEEQFPPIASPPRCRHGPVSCDYA